MEEKYRLLNESLEAVSSGAINLLVLNGDPGFGKSFNTLKFLEDRKIPHEYITSYSTPLKFYDLLYRSKDKPIIIFDDLDGLQDPKIIAMLKSACWNALGKSREVGYYSTSDKLDQLDLPEKFSLESGIILIMNKPLPDFEPIINRGFKIDFHFSYTDKLKIFKDVQVKAQISDTVLDYVTLNCNEATTNLSIRNLVILSNLERLGFNMPNFAKEMFKVDEEWGQILELLKTCETTEEACKEWCEVTGHSRRTFFRRQKILKHK